MEQVPIAVIIFVLLIQMGICVGLFLVFKLVLKLSTFIAICLVFLFMPLLLIFMAKIGLIHPYTSFTKISWVLCLLLGLNSGIILLIRFFRWVAKSNQNMGGVITSEERQKTLKMVEEGKINTNEASELLEALGRSSAMRGQDTFSRLDIMALLGIGLVVLGFFLPWVDIRIDMPGFLGTLGSGYQAGYHAGAIGWAVLITSILAAMPVFITPKDYLYKMSMLQVFLLILGSVITISLLIQANHMGAGLWFCLAGFVIAAIASFMKFKKLAA